MKQKVLLISGYKQGGKSSLRNYIMGVKLTDEGVLSRFNISTNGEFLVPSLDNESEVLKCLDLNNRDPNFINFAAAKIWPHCKNYSLGNHLKFICIDLFGLSYEQCFGSDDDKNTETNIRWSDIAFLLPPRRVGAIKNSGKFDYFLTAREFMEEFGSNVCRKIYQNCWVNSCQNLIKIENLPFCIIDDVRFENELDFFREEFETLSIRLLRRPFKSDSEAENNLNNYTDFDLVVPDISINEKNEMVLNFLREKSWL